MYEYGGINMKMKMVLILMSVVLLSGCGSNPSSKSEDKKLYEGLNGLETYKEAATYFNKNITYYKSESSDDASHSYNEYFQTDNGIATVTKALYSDAELTTLNYNIVNGKDYHTLFMLDSVTYKYSVAHDYTKHIDNMYNDLSKQQGVKIIDVKREDQDGQIVLTMKVEQEQRYQESDQSDEIVYYINELTINKDGYICEEKATYYTDDKFEDISYQGLTTKLFDYNKREAKDLDSEIELMKSCDGLNEDEVKDKIQLQW